MTGMRGIEEREWRKIDIEWKNKIKQPQKITTQLINLYVLLGFDLTFLKWLLFIIANKQKNDDCMNVRYFSL